MESSFKLKIIYSRPKISFVQKEEGGCFTKIIENGQAEHRKFAEVEVSDGALNEVKTNPLFETITFNEEEEFGVNLEKWEDPNVSVQVGIDVPTFIAAFASKWASQFTDGKCPSLDELLAENSNLASSYAYQKLTISFLKFVGMKDQKFLDDWEALVDKKFPPIYVLMNINGCLVHRTSEIIKFHKPKGQENDPKYDRWVKMFKVKRNFHYFRDGYMVFLTALMNHPRVRFSFYSTIMRKNILPIIMEMFKGSPNDLGLFEERLFNIFDQAQNRPAPEITGEKYGFIRDLDKVLATKKMEGKSRANILMLDSDEVSVHDCFENSLVIDRYERVDIWPDPNADHYRDQGEILTKIKEDLFGMLDLCQADVRDFLKDSINAGADEGSEKFKWSLYLRKAKQVSMSPDKVVDELSSAMTKLKVSEEK